MRHVSIVKQTLKHSDVNMGNSKKREKTMKKRRRGKAKKQKSIAFSKLISTGKQVLKKSRSNSLNDTLKAVIRSVKAKRRGKTVKVPRVLKLPKFGQGVRNILPTLSALSSVGSIASSPAGIVKTIRGIHNARRLLINRNGGGGGETKVAPRLSLSYKGGRGCSSSRGFGFYLKPYHSRRG